MGYSYSTREQVRGGFFFGGGVKGGGVELSSTLEAHLLALLYSDSDNAQI